MTSTRFLTRFVCTAAVFLLCAFASRPAHATHFRFGTISWDTPNPAQPNVVAVHMQTAWRWDYPWPVNLPPVGVTFNSGYQLQVFNGGGTQIQALPINLTVATVDSPEDWFFGTSDFTISLPGPGTYVVQLQNGNRLSTLLDGNNDQIFTVRSTIVVRSSNPILSSPRSTSLPIIYLQQNLAAHYTIPSIPSGPGYSFRLSTAAESGLVTPAPPGLTVDAAGNINWTPTTLGLYAMQVMLTGPSGESVPLDFILDVLALAPGTAPTLTINGAPGPASFAVQAGQPLSFTLAASDPDIDPNTNLPNTILSLSQGVLPTGSTMTPSLPMSGRSPVSAVFSWSPTAAQVGTYVVPFGVTDDTGRQTLTSATITVTANQPPTIVCPAPVTVEATSSQGATVSSTFVVQDPDGDLLTVSYAVDGTQANAATVGATTTPVPVTFSGVDALGSHSISAQVSDGHGHTVLCSSSVVVADTTPPVVPAPANIVAEATGPGGATVSFGPVTAVDTVAGNLVASCSPPSGGLFPLGVTPVTCGATDEAGNVGQASFTVTVRDTTPPVIGAVPANTLLEATSSSGATFTYSSPIAEDLVSGVVPVTCLPVSGSTFALGTTVVLCSAVDGAGNTATASFSVVVQDTTPPSLTAPAPETIEATGPGGAPATWTMPVATDLVSGTVPVTCSSSPGSEFALGTTTVTCGAQDAAGNIASVTFAVHVVDTTPPVITNVPANFTVNMTSAQGAVATYALPTANDLVSGNVLVGCVPASGSVFAPGVTTVSCTAADAAGNVASVSFVVTVADLTPPTISSVTPSPATLWPPNHQMVSVSVKVNDSDVDPRTTCNVVSVTSNEPINGLGDGDTSPDWTLPGGLNVNLRAERAGSGNGRIYTITVACVDGSGNRSTASTTVSVAKSQAH